MKLQALIDQKRRELAKKKKRMKRKAFRLKAKFLPDLCSACGHHPSGSQSHPDPGAYPGEKGGSWCCGEGKREAGGCPDRGKTGVYYSCFGERRQWG